MIEVEANGQIFEFPDGTSPEVMRDALMRHFGATQAPPQPQQAAVTAEPVLGAENPVTQAASGFNEGLGTVLGLPVDAINQAPRLANLIPGVEGVGPISERPFLGSEQITDALTAAGTIAPESQDPANQFVRRVGQEIAPAAAAIAAPGAAALRTPLVAARSGVPSVTQQAVQAARQVPVRTGLAEAGTALTAGLGAAAAQQAAPGNPLAEFAGQVAGSVLPGTVLNTARTAITGGETGRQAIAEAAEDFATAGASPSLGQATGNRLFQAIETGVGTLPGGTGRLVKAAEATQKSIGTRINSIVSDLTPRADATKAGKVIRQGIIGENGFLARFRLQSEKLFDDIPVADDAVVPVDNTLQAFGELTTPTEGATAISSALVHPRIREWAEAFSSDVGNGVLPYGAIKDLRTRIGEIAFSNDLIGDVPRAQLKRLYGALTDDMKAAAAGVEGGTRAFERANRFYSENIDTIDTFLNALTRKATPEEIFSLATRGSDGASRIGAIRNSLRPEEWKVVAGTVLRRMGRATPGNQDDLGDVFSSETFLTNWNRLDTRAKDALFKGRQFGQLRDDLDTIASATQRIREGSRVLANPAGTAPRLINVGGGVLGVASLATMNPILIAMGVGGPVFANLMARGVTNPKFIRWLAEGVKLPAQRVPGHITRLLTAASDDPDLMRAAEEFLGELQPLEDAEQP